MYLTLTRVTQPKLEWLTALTIVNLVVGVIKGGPLLALLSG